MRQEQGLGLGERRQNRTAFSLARIPRLVAGGGSTTTTARTISLESHAGDAVCVTDDRINSCLYTDFSTDLATIAYQNMTFLPSKPARFYIDVVHALKNIIIVVT